MSSTCSLVLVFLLCLSLHACNARNVHVVDQMLEKKTHFSIKVAAIFLWI
jgi:hypothetical protein